MDLSPDDYPTKNNWFPDIADEWSCDHMTRDEAVAACWAHQDAIEARGYAKCKADILALLSHHANQYRAYESSSEFNVRVVQIETVNNSIAAISRDAHVGAADCAKEQGDD